MYHIWLTPDGHGTPSFGCPMAFLESDLIVKLFYDIYEEIYIGIVDAYLSYPKLVGIEHDLCGTSWFFTQEENICLECMSSSKEKILVGQIDGRRRRF